MIIDIEKLVKIYKDGTKALDEISFQSQEKGSVITFIGPNGAGKSTLMRILACQLLPTSGKAAVLGYDVVKEYRKLRKYIVAVPQDISFHSYSLSPRDYIYTYLLMRGYSSHEAKAATQNALEALELERFADARAANLSGGTRKRMFLAMAFAVEDADVFFLDEPFSGLDPRSRVITWNLLRRLARDGKTFIVLSHYMEELQTITDRVIVMENGKIMLNDTPDNLLTRLFPNIERKIVVRDLKLKKLKNTIKNVVKDGQIISVGDFTFIYPPAKETLEEIISVLNSQHAECIVKPIGFEDIVLKSGVRSI